MSDDLVKRLRRKVQQFPAFGGGSIGIDADGKTTSTSYITDDGYRHANPDGPEAADRIEAQERTIAELQGALESISDPKLAAWEHIPIVERMRETARKALGGTE